MSALSDMIAPVLTRGGAITANEGTAELTGAAVAHLVGNLEHGHRTFAQQAGGVRQTLLLEPGVDRLTVAMAKCPFQHRLRKAEAGAEGVDGEFLAEMLAHVGGDFCEKRRQGVVSMGWARRCCGKKIVTAQEIEQFQRFPKTIAALFFGAQGFEGIKDPARPW